MARQPTRRAKPTDVVDGNPYLHFTLSELQAGLTSVTVYMLARMVSFIIEHIGIWLPLHDETPLSFFEWGLSWTSVFGAMATFVITTLSGIIDLPARVRKWHAGH